MTMLLLPTLALAGQIAEFPVTKTESVQSAAVSCSSGRRFGATFRWRPGMGIVALTATSSGTKLAAAELAKVGSLTRSATDLRYIQMWCAGRSDGGIRIAYAVTVRGRFTTRLLELQIRGRSLLVGTDTEQPSV